MPFSRVSRLGARLSLGALLALSVAGAVGMVDQSAMASSFDSTQKAEIEKIVRQYLIANPDVLLEAMGALEARQQDEKERQAKAALSSNKDKIFNDPASPVGGNPKGDVTVVEFFDYQCGYCKSVHADVMSTVREDGKVRFVYKEFPILGDGSVLGARAALAAREQGKYREVHDALMSHRGRLDEATVLHLAEGAGADVAKLKTAMTSEAVTKAIADNLNLAQELGIRGTPAFLFGEELVPGAIKKDEMKRLVAKARDKG